MKIGIMSAFAYYDGHLKSKYSHDDDIVTVITCNPGPPPLQVRYTRTVIQERHNYLSSGSAWKHKKPNVSLS